MTFRLGHISETNLLGVDTRLIQVTRRAIRISHQDFRVIKGLRSPDDQADAIRTGASHCSLEKGTCRHLTGQAIDLVAWVDGQIAWEPIDLYYRIAEAFRDASLSEGVPVRWGGSWVVLQSTTDMRQSVKRYVDWCRRQTPRKRPLIDSGHFELAGV